jgi:hypothetical protein
MDERRNPRGPRDLARESITERAHRGLGLPLREMSELASSIVAEDR